MSKAIWMLKQLLPFRYISEYSSSDHREVAAWHMWFGHAYDIKRWKIA